MKVIFIEPKGAYSNVFDKFMSIPLLGPVYLAAIAERAGHDTQVLNENILGRKIRLNEIKDADVLCISCLTPTITRGKQIAKQFKLLNPDGKTIIGGIHASMIPEDVKNDFDQIIVGEAENIILDVLNGKIKDKIVYGSMPENLDNIPIPNFRLIKKWRKIWTWPVMTSRGCPFNCNFCAVTKMFGRKYRFQSTGRVMKEILRYKRGKIFFVDDNFVANPKRTNELLDAMINSGFDRYWMTQVRTDLAKNPKLVAKMRKTGCRTVFVGFESINPRSLEEMNKNQTVEDIKHAIKVFHDNNMMVHGMFMLGSDSDTKETFKKTSEFCRQTKIDYVQYMVLTPIPGTELYKKIEKENRLLHKNWQFYDGTHTVFKPKNMAPGELQQGMLQCFNDFYSYTNAFRDALNKFAETGIAMFKKLYTKAPVPYFYPPLIKFLGKRIVDSWIRYNRDYLKYLNLISINKKL